MSLADLTVMARMAVSTSGLSSGVGGDRDQGGLVDLPALKRLEDEIERHHLGQRSGIAHGILRIAVQLLAARHVDDDGGVTDRLGAFRCLAGVEHFRCLAGGEQQRGQEDRNKITRY
jgi:hypothetical protein